MTTRLAIATFILGMLNAFSVIADDVQFNRDVLPILSDRCFHCHGPDEAQREADLRLDIPESALMDRGDYAAVVPGNTESSELLVRITTTDPDLKMPPVDSHRPPLNTREISILRAWIESGAVWGKHWSFETPKRPEVPTPTSQVSFANPIDAFVQEKLAEQGIEPSPPADKPTLIRRVTLDLLGLPPTLEEVSSFLADDTPQAYERLVDRLLRSPHYGERMAWPWLDAARYADTGGYQGDPDRSMWPWRDWLIDALNQNMPFDQFTIEMLAGDLLPNASPQQRLASGFNRNHMHNSEGGRIAAETRVENVFDRTETTGTVWLGLTLQCARCHDHKFDPTSNADYFAFYDFFNQSSENGKTDRSAAVPPFMEYETAGHGKVKVMVMDTHPERRETFVLVKGIYNQSTERRVQAGVPQMLPQLPPRQDEPGYSRLDLAQWIVSPDNPLTARVTVNRYWQLFFGRGIVATPGDFGLQGARPTHPQLLDWLAQEFIASGWDVKHLHRLIVTSQTYKQSAKVTPIHRERDPDNLWLARAPRHRLPSWMLRDQALAFSGRLSTTLGGPPVKPYQPDGVWAEATFGKKRYQPDTGSALYRRSIYTFWRRIIGPTMFFDVAKRQTCEVKPNRTNTPLHALTTLNDVTYVEAARGLAELALQAHDDDQNRIRFVFKKLCARDITSFELKLLTSRVAEYRAAFETQPAKAKELLNVGASTPDAAIDKAEYASYTTLCNTLMNLDEVLVRP